MSRQLGAGRVRATYEFIKAHRLQFSVEAMCRVLEVVPSSCYDWLKQQVSKRAQEDARLLRLNRTSFVASQGIYGSPRVFLDLLRPKRPAASTASRRFCRTNQLEPSMSRKGNCGDNAVAKSFFSSVQKERIKKHIYKNRELALADVSD